MNKKTKRLSTIRNIIESELISSQEELLQRLREVGESTTQSTLSRDMKFLKVARVPHQEKGYVYIIPHNMRLGQQSASTSGMITDHITGVDFSGEIGVIHTQPGYANAVAVLLDAENYFEVIGSIAGDDTIFMVLREGINRAKFVKSLASLNPRIEEIYNRTKLR